MVRKVVIYLFVLFSSFYAVDTELTTALKNPRVKAFLDMIAFAEGTAHDQGYKTQFTGTTFSHYSDHPRKKICGTINGKEVCSTAAGRYQLIVNTWDRIASRIGAYDFSPLYQDYSAIYLIREKGALVDIFQGKIGKAIQKMNRTWASFPESPYGHATKSLLELKNIYVERLAFYTRTKKSAPSLKFVAM